MTRRVCVIFGLVGFALVAPAPHGAAAAPRKADDYLTLDLARALLSPEPLGPPARFEPFGVQADTSVAGWSVAPPAVTAAAVPTRPVRHRIARRHANPFDAEAAVPAKPKPRIQRWPCKSGGICGWQTQPAPQR